jgi:hypothetical protein
MAAWKLPLVVSAIALPIVAGFYVGGPGLGMAVGALTAATIIVMAVCKPPLEEVAIAPAPDARPRLLVVLGTALEVSGAVAIAALAENAALAGAIPEVLLIAPCRSSFLERWTSDLEPGRRHAHADLEQGAALLANLGIAVSTRVGDEDTVQMTEDTLRTFAATELVLIDGKAGARTGQALGARLPIQLYRPQPGGRPTATRPALGHPGVSIQRTIRPLRTS